MPKGWKRMFGDCDHEHTLVISSVGVRRTVCESCGHISFSMTETKARESKSPVKRDLPKAAGL